MINRNQHYDDYVAKRMAKTAKFGRCRCAIIHSIWSCPISVLNFLSTCKTTYNSNGVSKGAAMWLFQVFFFATPPIRLVSREPAFEICPTNR